MSYVHAGGRRAAKVTEAVEGMRERPAASLASSARGLSDRALAWLFVGPTVALLLAFNIFPLLWTVWLSFTNYRANRPNAAVEWIGAGNYRRVLANEAIWETMRTTAHFLFA